MQEDTARSWNLRDRTISSYFILPMLRVKYNWLQNAGLINAFIGDESMLEYDNHIFLLMRPSLKPNYSEYEKELIGNEMIPYYVRSYSPISGYTMHIYSVPNEFQDDYNSLVKEEYTSYSKLSNKYKDIVLICHGADIDHYLYKIMNKDESMYLHWESKINEGLPSNMHIKIPRELEASRRMDMNIEIFRTWMR